jgi:hypothetical protein
VCSFVLCFAFVFFLGYLEALLFCFTSVLISFSITFIATLSSFQCVCVLCQSFYSLLLDVKGSFLLMWRILVVVVVVDTLFFEKRIVEFLFF